MQRAVSWIAVKGMEAPAILDILGFAIAKDGEKRPRASFGVLPQGWTVIYTLDFGFPTPERMKALSASGVAVACSSDDRSMASVARGYEDGQAVWAVEHDGGAQGPDHLAVAGRPPAEWPAIKAAALEEQAREDRGEAMVDCVFDAPIALAAALCGYRHDQDWPEGQDRPSPCWSPSPRLAACSGFSAHAKADQPRRRLRSTP